MNHKLLAALALLMSVPCFAQSWVKVATEANTLTLTAPATVRYGTSTGITIAGVDCSKANCWAVVPLKTAANLSLNDATCCVFGVPDPAPGLAKELDIQQGPTAVSVTISGKPVSVPALPPPSQTYTVNCPPFTATLTGTTLTSANMNCILTAVPK